MLFEPFPYIFAFVIIVIFWVLRLDMLSHVSVELLTYGWGLHILSSMETQDVRNRMMPSAKTPSETRVRSSSMGWGEVRGYCHSLIPCVEAGAPDGTQVYYTQATSCNCRGSTTIDNYWRLYGTVVLCMVLCMSFESHAYVESIQKKSCTPRDSLWFIMIIARQLFVRCLMYNPAGCHSLERHVPDPKPLKFQKKSYPQPHAIK